jgi:hypothetical protein
MIHHMAALGARQNRRTKMIRNFFSTLYALLCSIVDDDESDEDWFNRQW